MATISKRSDTGYWRAQVRRRGFEPISRTFDTRAQAEAWARRVESEMDRRTFVDQSEAEGTLLGEALERYRREVVPGKTHPYQEHQRINRWLREPLAKRSLTNLRGSDFAEYRDRRRKDGRAENTIRLELAIVGHVFEIARKEWGFEGLANPLKSIRKPSGSNARDRRLRPGEFELLHRLLANSGNSWAAPAMVLAVETALRQAKLFELRWDWVDLDACVIRLPAENRGPANKGVPPVLPLSTRAVATLKPLPRSIDGRVLGTTQAAVALAFKRARAKHLEAERAAGAKAPLLAGLTWHDLRHEATSRLFERGLHPIEVASVTGHRSMQMLKRYTHLDPRSLLARMG